MKKSTTFINTKLLHFYTLPTLLNTFLESMQDREIEVEDVAHIKKLRDVLEAKYAKVESKWESLSEEVEDPFEDQEEHDKCRGDY